MEQLEAVKSVKTLTMQRAEELKTLKEKKKQELLEQCEEEKQKARSILLQCPNKGVNKKMSSKAIGINIVALVIAGILGFIIFLFALIKNEGEHIPGMMLVSSIPVILVIIMYVVEFIMSRKKKQQYIEKVTKIKNAFNACQFEFLQSNCTTVEYKSPYEYKMNLSIGGQHLDVISVASINTLLENIESKSKIERCITEMEAEVEKQETEITLQRKKAIEDSGLGEDFFNHPVMVDYLIQIIDEENPKDIDEAISILIKYVKNYKFIDDALECKFSGNPEKDFEKAVNLVKNYLNQIYLAW